MNTITKKILIDRIAESTGMKRVAVKQVVQEFLDQVIVELGDGNRLEFRDFGVFEVKHRAPRIAQNPKTLERVPVPAKRTVKFKVGRRMREAMDTSDGTTNTQTPASTPVTATASQAESKIRVEMGSAIAGTIRGSDRGSESASVGQEAANAR
ncbi:integration host factor subunit beta [bacterium]|nr:MAG: integration host factor subunit beta [bacterium]